MAAGADSTGQKISQETIADVSIDATPSLIARATRTRQVVVVNDVSQEKDFLLHPALPLTESELVLPIVLGDRLLGVFDIQSQQINRFGPDDLRVLQSLAEQVAIAIQNAELFAQAQSAREEAEQANKVKSQFLATMSHELRTPLNAILNFSQFISSGMVGPVNEEQRELTEKIASSGKHLLALINDVLDISKIEAGAFKLFVEENVNLRQEFDMVSDTARSLLGGKPIQLVIEADDQIPLIVGDRRRIRQIMLNLVSNACKFTEKGHVRLRLYQRDHEIMFAVEDSGPGIAAEDQELIFETFRQAASGLAQGGTGLGLPISRRLVAAHGGHLWVESTVGKGSEFYVSFPIRSEELTRMIIAL
jgi:signal transduction histidine kinase